MTQSTESKVVPMIAPVSMDDVRRQVRDLMLKEDISQATLSREVGLSTSVISTWLAGTYTGKNDAVAAKMVKWLNGRSARKEMNALLPKAPAWAETPTAKRIYDALTYAQIAGDFTCIYGGSGLGKTATLRRYAQRNNNVWVVTATPARKGVANLLQDIASLLGFDEAAFHPHKLEQTILRTIRGTGGLLAVDEGQHLSRQALEELRSIHDAADGTIGLALLGNAAIYTVPQKGREGSFAQFFSRIGKRVALIRPTAGDVHAIAAAFGVSGKAEREKLELVARRDGGLREVVGTLRLACLLAGGNPITSEHIEAAFQDRKAATVAQEEAAS